jgi:hypothetical protein
MTDKKEAIQSIGAELTRFLKAGPKSPDHLKEVTATIYEIVAPLVATPTEATAQYKATCKAFVDSVMKVKGMPTRAIHGAQIEGRTENVSSSGDHIAKNFASLRPKITSRYDWCVENYRRQAEVYLDDQFGQFHNLLATFLREVPVGGSKDKSANAKITGIKQKLRSLTQWTKLFYIYKASSLAQEISHIFAVEEGALAVIWHYNKRDEEGEYRKSYNHTGLNLKTYAIRDNSAMKKGLMQCGAAGYYDGIVRPAQEVGCCCAAQYVYNVSSLPDDMLTAWGKQELRRVTRDIAAPAPAIAEVRRESVSPRPKVPAQKRPIVDAIQSETGLVRIKRRLLDWIGGRGS